MSSCRRRGRPRRRSIAAAQSRGRGGHWPEHDAARGARGERPGEFQEIPPATRLTVAAGVLITFQGLQTDREFLEFFSESRDLLLKRAVMLAVRFHPLLLAGCWNQRR